MRRMLPARFRGAPSRGQSLVEFALVLPVLLLMVAVAVDFGRVFLGYVNLNSTARIAANFAASNPDAWGSPPNAKVQAQYVQLIVNDLQATNCAFPVSPPFPTFTSGTTPGNPVKVSFTCNFSIITPIISNILGGKITVGASAIFPITTGIVTGVAGGGGTPAPVASFTASTSGGQEPLSVSFTDTSANNPTAWAWDFGDGTTSNLKNPTHVFTTDRSSTTFDVTLNVTNASGSSTSNPFPITVTSAPVGVAVANFTESPASGPSPLTVTFTDTSTKFPTSWTWDFGDSSGIVMTQGPQVHSYITPGTYSVKLTVSNATGTTSATQAVTVTSDQCTVPNLIGTNTTTTQSSWIASGFTTNVIFNPLRPPDYVIRTQTPKAGTAGACSSMTVTVTN